MKLAIFDLDGTLLSGNSWRVYLRHVALHRSRAVPATLMALAMRACGLIDGRRLREVALRPLRGLPGSEVRALGEALVSERLRALLRPLALREIERCRSDGLVLVLATGAFDFIARPMAHQLGIDRVVCTRLEYDGTGVCGGRISGPEARGPHKADCVIDAFREEAVDWGASRMYSDDLEDMPCFRLVGHPVWVRPAGDSQPVPANLSTVDWNAA